MNQDQMMGGLRWLIGVAGGWVVGSGKLDQATWAQVSAAAITIAPLIWSIATHTNAATVQSAAAIPGVAPIQITPAAPSSLQALAADSNVPSVVPAASPQGMPFASSQRR